jgi:hypothetical protein
MALGGEIPGLLGVSEFKNRKEWHISQGIPDGKTED